MLHLQMVWHGTGWIGNCIGPMQWIKKLRLLILWVLTASSSFQLEPYLSHGQLWWTPKKGTFGNSLCLLGFSNILWLLLFVTATIPCLYSILICIRYCTCLANSPIISLSLPGICIGQTGGFQVKLSELPWMERQDRCSIALILGGQMPWLWTITLKSSTGWMHSWTS